MINYECSIVDRKLVKYLILLVFMFTIGVLYSDNLEQSVLLMNDGKYDKAIEYLRGIDNPDISAKLILSIAQIQVGKYDEAEIILKEIIDTEPNLLPARYTLAMLYEVQKNYTEAITQWKYLLKLTKEKRIVNLAKKHIKFLREIQ